MSSRAGLRRTALLSILDMERRIRVLAADAYAQWLPKARAAVFHQELTAAAAEPIPPDPDAIALSQADWEEILASVFLAGLAEIMWAQLTAEMAGLGITAAEVIALGAAAAARSGLPGTTPGGDEDTPAPGTPSQPGEPEPGPDRPAPPDAPDRDDDLPDEPEPEDERPRDRDRDEDEPLTPDLVMAVPSVQEWVDGYLAAVNNRMVRTPETAFRLIADELAVATREGESPDQQAARVARILSAENLDTFGGRRPALVARTETCGALNGARLEAARVMAEITGEDLHKVWLATIDGRTRDTHFAVDGQRQPLDGEFELPGGVKMRWPGEPGAPASEVCNCRCALIVVGADEDLPDESDRHTERGPGNATVRNREGTRQDEIDRRAADGVIRARDDPNGIGDITSAAPPPERIRPMQTFTAVLAHLGVPTDDGRMLAADIALRFRDTPLPLRWQRQDIPMHGEAFTVGAIDSISVQGSEVIGAGHLIDTAEAAEAALQIREGVTAPSVDLADVEWEIRDDKGNPILDFDDVEEDAKLLAVTTSAIVTAATLVAIPAFGNTSITLDQESDEELVAAAATTPRFGATTITLDDDVIDTPADTADVDKQLLAAAAVRPWFRPSGTMFADPGFTEPTPLHMTDDGRIQGHLAVWGICHVGISDRCVTAPRSATAYAHFHVSSVETSDGVRLPVGRLTVGGGHAGHGLDARAASEHYDTLCTSWAYVRAGEDAHGIWVSGVPHPAATDEQVRDGLSAPLSGDWRSVGGHLELVAALSVNTPGFPVLRAREEEGRVKVLVASLAPRYRRTDPDETRLRFVARTAVHEYRQGEARRAAALGLIRKRRRTTARALIAAVRNRKA
ncbi:phage minor head protein [Nocardia sp. CA-290969]|uniref:phage minor head protein n=1 Tax=Nocardia sp. CA-290969 TaxID=3239986 RepID=UPI003D8E978C